MNRLVNVWILQNSFLLVNQKFLLRCFLREEWGEHWANSSGFAQQSSKSQDDLLIFLSQVLLKYEYHQKNNSSWDYSEMLIPLTSDKKVKLMYYKALNKRILVSSKFPCWHLTSGKKPSRWVGPILKSFFTCTPKTTFLVALSGDKLTFLRLEKKQFGVRQIIKSRTMANRSRVWIKIKFSFRRQVGGCWTFLWKKFIMKRGR